MKSHRFLVVLGALTLAACAQFPELDGTVTPESENAAYPQLLPLEPILAQVGDTTVEPAREEAILQSRLSALRARAARLRGSVLSGAEKQRLQRGLS